MNFVLLVEGWTLIARAKYGLVNLMLTAWVVDPPLNRLAPPARTSLNINFASSLVKASPRPYNDQLRTDLSFPKGRPTIGLLSE